MLFTLLLTLTLCNTTFPAEKVSFATSWKEAEALLSVMWSNEKHLFKNHTSFAKLEQHVQDTLNAPAPPIVLHHGEQSRLNTIFLLLNYLAEDFKPFIVYCTDDTLFYQSHQTLCALKASKTILALYQDNLAFSGNCNILMTFLNHHYKTNFASTPISHNQSFQDFIRNHHHNVALANNRGCAIFRSTPIDRSLSNTKALNAQYTNHEFVAYMIHLPSFDAFFTQRTLSLRTSLSYCKKSLCDAFQWLLRTKRTTSDFTCLSSLLYCLTVDHSTCLCPLKAAPHQKSLILLVTDMLLSNIPANHPQQIDLKWSPEIQSLFIDCRALECMHVFDFATHPNPEELQSLSPPSHIASAAFWAQSLTAKVDHLLVHPVPPCALEPNALLLLLSSFHASFCHTFYTNTIQNLTLPALDQVISFITIAFADNATLHNDPTLHSIISLLDEQTSQESCSGKSDHTPNLTKMLLYLLSYITPSQPDIDYWLESHCNDRNLFTLMALHKDRLSPQTIPLHSHTMLFLCLERLSLSHAHFCNTASFLKDLLNLKPTHMSKDRVVSAQPLSWKEFNRCLERNIIRSVANPIQELILAFQNMPPSFHTRDTESSLQSVLEFMSVTLRHFKEHYSDPTIRALLHIFIDSGVEHYTPILFERQANPMQNTNSLIKMLVRLTSYLLPKTTNLTEMQSLMGADRITPSSILLPKFSSPPRQCFYHMQSGLLYIQTKEAAFLFNDFITFCFDRRQVHHSLYLVGQYKHTQRPPLPSDDVTFFDNTWANFLAPHNQ